MCRPPKGNITVFRKYWKDFLNKKTANNKTVFMVGVFNINYFDCDNNEWFLALIQMTPRVKRTTATAIDFIITDSIKESIMCLSNKLLVNFLNFMFF